MKPIEMSWRMTKLSKILLWILLIIILIGAGTWAYFYKFKKSDKNSSNSAEKSYQLAIYSLVQDGKARVVAYDPKTKEHNELMSIDCEDKYSSFSADYSSSLDKIVYSDDNGISVYDLKDKTKSDLLTNIKPKSTDELETNERTYTAPKWSKDYKKIVYKVAGYESMSWAMMDSDGKNQTQIDGEGYSFAWSSDGERYAIGSESGMGTGPGINVSLTDPITKTKQILSEKDMRQVNSLAWQDRIYISGAVSNNLNIEEFEIDSVNADGTDLKVLDKDSYDNQGLVADENGTLYYSKNIIESDKSYSTKSAGIYSIQTDGTNKALFYQDGDNNLTVQALNSEYVAIQSNENAQNSNAFKSLLLVNKNDKQTALVGEAVKINFVGWIKSNKMPDGLTKLKTPEPSQSEKSAYSESLKTHGYLYASYYEYCWDYDCSSSTYPYPKLATSATPEIITLSTVPNQLIGNVSVPVIFAYDSTPFTDDQLALLKNSDQISSYGYFEKWLNDQAQKNGASLNFKFDYKVNQLKVDQSCIVIQGTNRLMDQTCLRQKIVSAYPELKDKNNIVVAIARDDSIHYNFNTSFSYSSEGKLVLSNFSQYYLSRPVKELSDAMAKYSDGFNYYNAKQFLSQYGAKDLVASYKSPVNNAQSSCYVDARTDIMCGSWLTDPIKGYLEYIKIDAAEISTVTAKALGWYDADGDGVIEAKDKCPFDKKNAC